MRGGRFLSCRHGAIGVVHLVVVHGPGHGVDFSGIVSESMFSSLWKGFQERKKKNSKDFFLSSLVKKKKAHASLACAFFHGCTTSKNTSITQVLVSQL